MKRKYWLKALILGGLGAFLYFVFYAYTFTGLLLMACAAVVLVFGLVDRLRLVLPVSMTIVRHLLRTVVSLVVLAAVVTGVWIAVACDGAEDPQSDYVIVLGAGVNGTAPSESLRERLEAAKAYLEEYPQAIAVLSGGQGDRENITEAQCMYNWLTENGIDPGRLRKEEQATTTEENIRYSLDLLEQETGTRPDTAAVVSSAYHLRRASLLARREGLTMLGVPASTRNPFFFCNMFLREICGVWYTLVFG